MSEKKWLVFYTKSRHEKKCLDLLLRRGFEAWLPMVKELRQWSDRKKKVEAPLFRSYIFVYLEEHQLREVLQLPGISWNIRHNDKPAVLHEKDKKIIEQVLDSGYAIEEESEISDFISGQKVLITSGALKNNRAIVIGKDDPYILIQLESIDKNIRVKLPFDVLKPDNSFNE